MTTVPVTISTGFLGSGKTTLLGNLLADPAMRDTAVIVNEIGAVALDHDLVKNVREDLIVLGSGCVCCSIRNDLMRTLCDLHNRVERREIPRFSRVVIETTGLADPTPIVGTVAKNGLLRTIFHLAAVVTTVDATLGERTLDANPEAVKQAAIADRILVTKTDLADSPIIERLEGRLAALNPLAPRLRVREGVVDRGAFFARVPAHPVEAPPDPREHGPHHHHDDGDKKLISISETFDAPIDYPSFALWLSMMTQIHGECLLRVKSILHFKDDPLPVVAQSVQHVVYPVTGLPAWPFQPPASRVVVIARGLEGPMVEAIRASLRALGGEGLD